MTPNPQKRQNAIARCRERRIVIPTLAQQRDPALIARGDPPRPVGRGHAGRRPPQPLPHHLAQRPRRPAASARSNALELPSSLTGVPARIVGLVGKHFPTGAHKVGAAFGCLVPRLVSRRVRPHDPEGGLAVHRQLLPRRRLRLGAAGLPGGGDPAQGDEPGALRLARVDRRRDHRHAGVRVQRQGDLRRLLGDLEHAAGVGDLQPVRGVGQLPVALRGHRPGRRGGVHPAGPTRGPGSPAWVGATGSAGTLAAGDYLKQRFPGCRITVVRGAAVPDPAATTASAPTASRGSATSTCR